MLSNLFPNLWYFSAYFVLFFFMPILDCILEYTPRKFLAIASIVIVVQLLKNNFVYFGSGYSVTWLVILYVLGGYLSKNNVLEKWTKKKCFLCYFGCVLVTELFRICYLSFYTRISFLENYKFTLIKYTSPTIILSAVFLVCCFSKINFNDKYLKFIQILSPLAFGVYLFHEQPFIRNSIIKGTFSFIASEPFYIAIPLVLASSSLIFICCLLIEYLRSCIFNTLNIKRFAELLEKLIYRFFSVVLKI